MTTPVKPYRERPMLFSDPMVRAILGGRKTQTRRVVNGSIDPEWWSPRRPGIWEAYRTDEGEVIEVPCPYGAPGDRLWVREAWRGWVPSGDPEWHVRYRADGATTVTDTAWDEGPQCLHPADVWCDMEPTRWRPSIHMPRWASRILLEITEVRVERAQAISEEDARAEGCETTEAVLSYAVEWTRIYGPSSWASNPWVWAISFRRLEEAR